MNRHSYIINEIEQKLSSLSINKLSRFELQKAQSYQYPYFYVELQNETIDYPYEDYFYGKVSSQFAIWVGIETSTDGDLRTVFGDLTEEVESVFKGFEIQALENSNYTIDRSMPRITGIYPVSNFNEIEFLYVITGELEYNITWK